MKIARSIQPRAHPHAPVRRKKRCLKIPNPPHDIEGSLLLFANPLFANEDSNHLCAVRTPQLGKMPRKAWYI